jgi:protein-tyrosine phosphatase
LGREGKFMPQNFGGAHKIKAAKTNVRRGFYMIYVTFICLGNICRSPMAQLIFTDMVQKEGLELSFRISSFGTSDEEEGNSIYYPARQVLARHGITGEHRAKKVSLTDIKNNDYILVMDSGNLFDVLRLTSGEYGEKIFKLCSFTDHPRDVADPWFTRDFERAYADIADGCAAFLNYIKREHAELLQYDKWH